MTELAMTLRLSNQASEKLAQRAASEQKEMAQVASELIEQAVLFQTPADIPYNQWAGEFREWILSHKPVGHFVDDSRESIYDGRGE